MDKAIEPKIFVIILNYNGAKTLADCLSSLYRSEHVNFEVVVVDNDSRDGSFENARTHFSRAHFIKNSSNVGFSKGNNVGIRFALEKFADYVFLLNNDTVVERDVISRLIQELEKNKTAGIANPLILNAQNNSVWFAGGKIYWMKMRTAHQTAVSSNLPYSTEYATGCAMMVSKKVFKKIGLLDERFFLYYEDADFSLRAKKVGFDILVIPDTTVHHSEQSNSKNKNKTYWLVRSGILFFKTHSSFPRQLWLVLYINGRKIKNFFDVIFSKNPLAKDVRRAYVDSRRLDMKK